MVVKEVILISGVEFFRGLKDENVILVCGICVNFARFVAGAKKNEMIM